MASSRIFLGFNFYGAGNVGDDLMLKGFLDVYDRHCGARLVCALPSERIRSQKLRFSQIEWLSLNDKERERVISSCNGWLGVGGTPFQASSGRWLLNKITQDFEWARNKKKWMIGIGCEEEVLREKTIASRIAREVDHIWTRDEKSRDLLVGSLGADSKKVTTGGDLAHMSLKEIFAGSDTQSSAGEAKVGIVYYAEGLDQDSVRGMIEFVTRISEDKEVTFLANDTRREKGFEYAVYKSMFGGIRSFMGTRPLFFAPDYNERNVAELVKHSSNYGTVMASRYHAILAAAWAGCKIVALDRSSKIRNLVQELNIPLIKSPFTVDALFDGYSKAITVPRGLLEKKALAAEKSVIDLCNLLH